MDSLRARMVVVAVVVAFWVNVTVAEMMTYAHLTRFDASVGMALPAGAFVARRTPDQSSG